jgi:hypothetical protein
MTNLREVLVVSSNDEVRRNLAEMIGLCELSLPGIRSVLSSVKIS